MKRMFGTSGNEEGQILLIALAFITFVGVVGVALLSYAATNLHSTNVLRQLRAEEFAADGAVTVAVNSLRQNGWPCPTTPVVLNNLTVVVTCKQTPSPLDV